MTDVPSKNEKKTSAGRFKPGGLGGPGRPAGSRNKATLALDSVAEESAKEILEKMAEAAKGGDMRAAEMILARVWPARKSRTVALSLPPVVNAADIVSALDAVATAMATGEITPDCPSSEQ